MRTLRITLLVAIAPVLLAGCRRNEPAPPPTAPAAAAPAPMEEPSAKAPAETPPIHHWTRQTETAVAAPGLDVWGALHRIHAQGETGPTVGLASLEGPHRYALGALAGLAGEITIVDSEVWLARPEGDTGVAVAQLHPPSESATLLVSAVVPAWRARPLPLKAGTVEEAVAEAARSAGLPDSEPFPFLLVGTLESVHWHVVDASNLPAGGGSCADHARLGRQGELSGKGLVLGFYSTGHTGVFTRPGSNLHMHVLSADRKVSGHVDRMPLPAGATLYLPAAGPLD